MEGTVENVERLDSLEASGASVTGRGLIQKLQVFSRRQTIAG
jgi:hypothetical protein